jgi:metal-responsive CopG/Arc/MetJ family transcriptional regulator
MKNQMMLGEQEFLKAVLIIMILVMTFVCLNIFVLKSDAAEISKVRMKTTSIQNVKTVRLAGRVPMTHWASLH